MFYKVRYGHTAPRLSFTLCRFGRAGLCLFSGYLFTLAFPPHALWPLAILLPPLWCWCIGFAIFSHHGLVTFPDAGGMLPWRTAALRGFLIGFGFFVPILHFTSTVAGVIPWIGFACLESLFFSLWALLIAIIDTYSAQILHRLTQLSFLWIKKLSHYHIFHVVTYYVFTIINISGTFLAVEWLRARIPFGGFPWLRLGFAINSGILLPLVSLLSVSGMTLLCMCCGLVVGVYIKSVINSYRAGSYLRIASISSLVLIVMTSIIVLSQQVKRSTENVTSTGKLSVAVIQINTDFLAQRYSQRYFEHTTEESLQNSYYPRNIPTDLDEFVHASMQLAQEIRNGHRDRPDVVFWSENALDIDPFSAPEIYTKISSAAQALGVPLVIGTILIDHGKITNSIIVWDPLHPPQRTTDAMITHHVRHDKNYVQPFGEYVPWRNFFRTFFSVVDQANNISPGHDQGIIDVGVHHTPIAAAICYEVAFDQFFRRAMSADPQLLAVPTNNSSFGYSPMTYIQLAMSEVRAVEFHRAVVVAAKTGVSGFITPDGRVHNITALANQDTIIMTLPLYADRTPASTVGPVIEWFAVLLTASLLYSSGRRKRKDSLHKSHTA